MGKLQFVDILYYLKEEFIKSFEFTDVKSETVFLFTQNEIDSILAKSYQPHEQINELLFILKYAQKDVLQFLNAIRTKYNWLYDLCMLTASTVDNSGLRLDRLLSLYESAECDLRSEIPKHLDYNVHRCLYLKTMQRKLLQLKRREYYVLHGNLGAGKRWLAMDACCNYSIMEKMNFKIYWINAGKIKTQDDVLSKLQRLKILLKCDDRFDKISRAPLLDKSNQIFELLQNLREILEDNFYKDCLIILANVQSVRILKSFDLRCKILITTRNKEIMNALPSMLIHTEQITNGFQPNESLQLFEIILKKKLVDEEQDINVLRHLCKGSPFVLSIIARNLRNYCSNKSNKNRWAEWIKTLSDYNSSNFVSIDEPIKLSLSDLSEEHLQLFNSLVIFKDDFSFSSRILQMYWNQNEKYCEEILIEFEKLYLIESHHHHHSTINQLDYKTYTVQYHYYLYLNSHIDGSTKKKLHCNLVNSYYIPMALAERKEPILVKIPDDDYFYYYIGYHLKESMEWKLFSELYLDFGFLESKLRISGLSNTLGDLLLYRSEIAGKDKRKLEFIDGLLEFLPNIEETMIKSIDTCLIQYAMTTNGAMQQEAIRQAKTFENRLWFTDKDHSNKRRQIIKLPDRPYLIRFIEANTAITVLQNHTILLTDLSPYYTIEPTVYKGHQYLITDLQIFLKRYFITIDQQGICKLWSMKNTPIDLRRHSDVYSDNDSQRINRDHQQHSSSSASSVSMNGISTSPSITSSISILNSMSSYSTASGGAASNHSLDGNNFQQNHNYNKEQLHKTESFNIKNCSKQTWKQQLYYHNKNDIFKSMYLLNGIVGIELFLITQSGHIVKYQFDELLEQFVMKHMIHFPTNVSNTMATHFIPPKYLMTLNKSGSISFFNTMDQSNVGITSNWKPYDTPIGVHDTFNDSISSTCSIKGDSSSSQTSSSSSSSINGIDVVNTTHFENNINDNNNIDIDETDANGTKPPEIPKSFNSIRSIPKSMKNSKCYYRIAIVFAEYIIEIRFLNSDFTVLYTDFSIIYSIQFSDDRNQITCSTITDDKKYLILGTKKGIIVFDINERCEKIRSSVSDYIRDIDVFTLDNAVYKYVLMAITKLGGACLNIYGLEYSNFDRESMIWSSDRMGSPISVDNLNGRNTLNTWLIGGQLFDVIYNFDDLSDFKIYAVDSANRIYQQINNLRPIYNWNAKPLAAAQSLNSGMANVTVTDDNVLSCGKITCISATKNYCLIGCDNGMVWKLNESSTPLISFYDKMNRQSTVECIIVSYLKCYELDDLFCVGTARKYCIRFKNVTKHCAIRSKLVNTILLNDQLILLIKEDCTFEIFDLTKMTSIVDTTIMNGNESSDLEYTSSAMVDDILMISSSRIIFIYKIGIGSGQAPQHKLLYEFNVHIASKSLGYITCIRISPDKTIFAVGFDTGAINLYKIPSTELFYELVSHKTKINDMLFSPWIKTANTSSSGSSQNKSEQKQSTSETTNDDSTKILPQADLNNNKLKSPPLILVSCSEQICFWNISYAMNNPIAMNRNNEQSQRRSQRFNKKKISIPLGDIDLINDNNNNNNNIINKDNDDVNNNPNTNGNCTNSYNQWIGKLGPSDKSELLSCIKFVGNSAEKIFANSDFTTFITIDDEGDVYTLDLLNEYKINKSDNSVKNNDQNHQSNNKKTTINSTEDDDHYDDDDDNNNEIFF